MAFDTGAAATQLLAVLNGLSGMGAAQIGAPESIGPRVSAYVTMGGFSAPLHATGVWQREQRFTVMFAYRVDGAETTAETTLMSLVDAFCVALAADFSLSGSVKSILVDSSAADEPDYQLHAGKEYREYPLSVTITQRGNFTVNP